MFTIPLIPPKICVISLDIANMFNKISRKRTQDIIDKHFPYLAHMSNLLLTYPITCYFFEQEGIWNFFKQEEGLLKGSTRIKNPNMTAHIGKFIGYVYNPFFNFSTCHTGQMTLISKFSMSYGSHIGGSDVTLF